MKKETDRRLLITQVAEPYGRESVQRILTFPSSWRVTFGPVSPSSKGQGGNGVLALRIYRSEKDQYACFVGVQSFRDLDRVKVENIVVKKRVQAVSDTKGNSRSEVEVDRAVEEEDL